jgi:hypothetical protein
VLPSAFIVQSSIAWLEARTNAIRLPFGEYTASQRLYVRPEVR